MTDRERLDGSRGSMSAPLLVATPQSQQIPQPRNSRRS